VARALSRPRGNDTWRRRPREGITTRHRRRCPAAAGGRCACSPAYQAQVYSPVDHKQIRKTFATIAEARAWRQETQIAVRRGRLRGPSKITLDEAATDWLTAAHAGAVRTRSGYPYKPAAIRSYRQSLNHHVLPILGSKHISAISKRMLQDLCRPARGKRTLTEQRPQRAHPCPRHLPTSRRPRRRRRRPKPPDSTSRLFATLVTG
jgi:hypothetical protein